MKRALARAAFVSSFIVLTIIFLVPLVVVFNALFSARRGPDGIYRGGDPLWLGILPMFLAMWLADRCSSLVFWSARISDERWSVFRRRRHGTGQRPALRSSTNRLE